MYHYTLTRKFPYVEDPPQVLFSGHGTEATDTGVKAREKSAVKLFATRQLCWLREERELFDFSLFSLNLVHSVLSINAAVSNHRNCLHVALFLETSRMCFRG